MAQTSITNFFAVRTSKRKRLGDEELSANKISRPAVKLVEPPIRRIDPIEPLERVKRIKPVARLTFDDETPESKPLPAPSPAPAPVPVAKSARRAALAGELAAKLSSFREGCERLKAKSEAREKSSLRDFGAIDVFVPTSPRKSAGTASDSPSKSPSKIPAYLRYASLADATPTLILPLRYRWLAEAFRAIETVSSMLHNRGETVTFSKIKPAAQEMLKRNLTENHLSQIKGLCPEMYKFSRDKNQLVLSPSLAGSIFGPEAALERRRRFHGSLVDRVKKHHEAFLISLDPPLTIPGEKLTRWHPEFDLERVPDLELDQLPPLPETEKYTSARDVLARAKEMFSDERVRKAVERLAEKRKNEGDPIDADREKIDIPGTPRFINPALRNVPNALLQKVKARQAEKALKAMTSKQSDDTIAYQKLPDLARTLRNLFLAEKKSILPVEILIPKLENSFNGTASSSELMKHLKMLASHAPEWLTIVSVRNLELVKILKYSDFTQIISKLESLAKDFEP